MSREAPRARLSGGDLYCSEADYIEGRNAVLRMAGAYEKLRADPAKGTLIAQQFYAAVQSVIDRWNDLTGRPVLPFSPVKCTARDLGLEADTLTRQLYAAALKGGPVIPQPTPGLLAQLKGEAHTLIVGAAVVLAAVVVVPPIVSSLRG